MNLSKHWAATLDDYAIDLGWSPDGTILAAASAAGSVTLYDATTGTIRHVLTGHDNGTNCIAWQPVGSELATGGQDGFVRFWDAITGRQTAETKLGTAWVEHLAWSSSHAQPSAPALSSPNGLTSQLLFASAGKKLVALKSDGALTHTFPDAPKTITALALSPAPTPDLSSPNGLSSQISTPTPMLSAAYFGGVCNWNTTTFAAEKELPYGNTIHALTWSPDGRWLVAGCQDNAVHLWMPAGDEEFHMSGYETKLKELSFSRDSKWLATGGGRDACVWDCTGAGPEGREPMLLPHSTRVCAVAFQHQHGLLATAAASGEFCLWSPSRKNPLIAEAKMPSAATKFAWSPDDSLLAVGTEKGAVFVFKITD